MREPPAIGRRAMLLGLAGVAASPPALADDSLPSLAHGRLADNAIAKAFEKAPRQLPDVTLISPSREIDIHALKGRTILMPLWAEWCAPCLSEIPDFAKLQKKYGGPKFCIIPILTAPRHKLMPTNIAEIFRLLHAEVLPEVVEKDFGDKLLRTMCRKDGGVALPCNLLLAPDGTVVGREMGRLTADDASSGPAPEKTPDAETVTRAMHGQAQSVWGKPDGEEFAAAMAAGFLG